MERKDQKSNGTSVPWVQLIKNISQDKNVTIGTEILSEPLKLIDSANVDEKAVNKLQPNNIGIGIQKDALQIRASKSVPSIIISKVEPNIAREPLRDFLSFQGIKVVFP